MIRLFNSRLFGLFRRKRSVLHIDIETASCDYLKPDVGNRRFVAVHFDYKAVEERIVGQLLDPRNTGAILRQYAEAGGDVARLMVKHGGSPDAMVRPRITTVPKENLTAMLAEAHSETVRMVGDRQAFFYRMGAGLYDELHDRMGECTLNPTPDDEAYAELRAENKLAAESALDKGEE